MPNTPRASSSLEVPLDDLLRTVAEKTAESLRALIDDKEVDYLIILENASKDKRKFIPAGAGLDFRSPKDAAGKIIGGMRMSAYVDFSKTRAETAQSKIRKAAQSKSKAGNPLEEEKLRQRLEWAQKENYMLESKVSSAKKQILARNQVIEELEKQIEGLQSKLYALEQDRPETDAYVSRNSDLEAAEEELMARMNQYMEKEAELEQREEDLFHQERRFHEMQNNSQHTA